MKTQQILDNLRAKELKALAKSAGLPRTVTRTPEIVAELNRFLYTAPPGLAAKAACSAVAKPSSRVRSVPAKSSFSKAWAFSHRPGNRSLRNTPCSCAWSRSNSSRVSRSPGSSGEIAEAGDRRAARVSPAEVAISRSSTTAQESAVVWYHSRFMTMFFNPPLVAYVAKPSGGMGSISQRKETLRPACLTSTICSSSTQT